MGNMGKGGKEKQIGTPVNSCSCWSTVIQSLPGHWSLQLPQKGVKYIRTPWVGVYEELLLSCLPPTTCTPLMETVPSLQISR